MGFIQYKAQNDIWVISKNNLYEYIFIYVDDLVLVSNNPSEITDIISNTYNLKLKGTGPIGYHLGSDLFKDKGNVMCMYPSKNNQK